MHNPDIYLCSGGPVAKSILMLTLVYKSIYKSTIVLTLIRVNIRGPLYNTEYAQYWQHTANTRAGGFAGDGGGALDGGGGGSEDAGYLRRPHPRARA
eukprot:2612072-Pyramimonas_sp.AAC.2